MNAYDQVLRKRVDKMLQLRAAISANVFGLVMLAAAWERGRGTALTLVIVIGYAVYGTIFGKAFHGRLDRTLPNLAFAFSNTGYALGVMWAFDFDVPSMLVVPLMILLFDGFSEGDGRRWVTAMLAIILGGSLAMGAPPLPILAAVAVGGAVHWFSEGRALILRSALAELREQAGLLQEMNLELGGLHAKMVAQERLSGLGQMAAGVAHEINNPLAYVTSNVSALAMDLNEFGTNPRLAEEYRTQVIPATLDGLARVSVIISDLRRFARADPAKKEIFNVDREVLAALRVCRGQLEANCDLEVELEQALKVDGQGGQICQVLVNLLSNAAHAMRNKRGKLRLSARRNGGNIELIVQDQGEGMLPDLVSRIFEPFVTTKAPGEGTGLGLSVVHGIVRSHGGNIEVASVPGEGTTFVVKLPAAPVQQAAA